MNDEGMDDRYYFSDWGSCTCSDDDVDTDCPFIEEHDEEDDDDE